MLVKEEISSFDSNGEKTLKNQTDSEREMKLDKDIGFYHASDESFSKSKVDFETNRNENENVRAKRLIW